MRPQGIFVLDICQRVDAGVWSWFMWSQPWVLLSGACQFLLTVFGVVSSRYSDWANRNRWLVVAGFTIVGLIGLYATIQQVDKSARDSTEARTTLQNLQNSTEEIRRLQNLNTDLQRKLLASSDTIKNLAQQNINTVIGGDSFCYASIASNVPYVTFVHQGKYPLSNVVARVVDLTQLKAIQAKSARDRLPDEEQRALMGTTIVVGELIPGSAVSRNVAFTFSSSGQEDFNVFFSARNGFWEQLIRWRKVEEKWVLATKVTGHGRRKPLYEQIDKNFPRNGKGIVEW